MRTLLDESFPPNCINEEMFSTHGRAKQMARTFPPSAVLGRLDDLMEVGVDGTVIATPGGSHVKHASTAPERGVAVFRAETLRHGVI